MLRSYHIQPISETLSIRKLESRAIGCFSPHIRSAIHHETHNYCSHTKLYILTLYTFDNLANVLSSTDPFRLLIRPSNAMMEKDEYIKFLQERMTYLIDVFYPKT